MQNTMVRGGDGQLGTKIEVRKKRKKEKKNGGKFYLKKGKGLKNASYWAILICRGKN